MTKTKVHASATAEVNEELIDTLVAISVVAKKLGKKIRYFDEFREEA